MRQKGKYMKNLTIVNEILKANTITHSGIFHADEVMATVLLSKILPEVRLCRTFKVPEELSTNVIVYDIGGGVYDHHQRGFSEARGDGIKFSSFGLLWRKFGMQLLSEKLEDEEAKLAFDFFDKSFVSGIDAVDNGQTVKSSDSVYGIISAFNSNWDEVNDENENFIKAVEFSEIIFDNTLKSVIAKVKAKTAVEYAIRKSANGIMVLDQFMPWQDYIFSNDKKAKNILYVVFPSKRGGYNVQAVPDGMGSFGQRKPLPKEWAGLKGAEFALETGISTANFCHPGKFICGADTFEDAMCLAKKAVEA